MRLFHQVGTALVYGSRLHSGKDFGKDTIRNKKSISRRDGFTVLTLGFRQTETSMHTPETVKQTLELLWGNYLALAERVDPEAMDPDTFAHHCQQNTPIQPLRLATWLARQSFFLAAWSLWEQYSASVCTGADAERPKSKHVDWVRKTMDSQKREFKDYEWFLGAYNIRNLIAHYFGRIHVKDERPQKLLEDGKKAFRDIDITSDGYLFLTHDHVSELMLKIEDYLDESVENKSCVHDKP